VGQGTETSCEVYNTPNMSPA